MEKPVNSPNESEVERERSMREQTCEAQKIPIRRLTGSSSVCPSPGCNYKTIFTEPVYKEVCCPSCHKSYLYDVGDIKKAIS
jgi:hypothetical protein